MYFCLKFNETILFSARQLVRLSVGDEEDRHRKQTYGPFLPHCFPSANTEVLRGPL